MAVWTVRIEQQCDQKYWDWINPNNSIQNVDYDLRNPPTSPLIATYVYSGPLTSACGNPVISITNSDGSNTGFLSATLNSVTGNIEISLPNS